MSTKSLYTRPRDRPDAGISQNRTKHISAPAVREREKAKERKKRRRSLRSRRRLLFFPYARHMVCLSQMGKSLQNKAALSIHTLPPQIRNTRMLFFSLPFLFRVAQWLKLDLGSLEMLWILLLPLWDHAYVVCWTVCTYSVLIEFEIGKQRMCVVCMC